MNSGFGLYAAAVAVHSLL